MAGHGDPTPEEEQPWVDLMPTHVVHLMALRLHPPDLSSFQKVCKSWRNLPMESYPLGQSPLFLFAFSHSFSGGYRHEYSRRHLRDRDKLFLHSPLYNMTLSWAASSEVREIFNSPGPFGMLYSKDGWVVFIRRDEPGYPAAVVFVNPFLPSTAAAALLKWRLPALDTYLGTVSMSASPTDPACIFLLIRNWGDGVQAITTSDGGMNWKFDFFRRRNLKHRNLLVHLNPVFRSGVFYCLMSMGGLGIYDPRRRSWKEYSMGTEARTWKEYCMGTEGYWSNILVESGGELLRVGRLGRFSEHLLADPSVYELDESSMEWKKSTELRGRALFLDGRSATSAVAEVDGMKDRIFYNYFHDHADAKMKVDCELHRSAGGDPRLVPRPHVGLAELARRAEGKSVVAMSRLSLRGAGEEAKQEEEPWGAGRGLWVRPNWDSF